MVGDGDVQRIFVVGSVWICHPQYRLLHAWQASRFSSRYLKSRVEWLPGQKEFHKTSPNLGSLNAEHGHWDTISPGLCMVSLSSPGVLSLDSHTSSSVGRSMSQEK